jgi:hypothetical protein
MAERERPTPEEEIRRLYGEAEASAARAAERVVSRDSFGELLAMMTENVVSLTRIATETFDLVLRNLRLASRRDLIDLGRQLGRTEDKLERVLQEVEGLRDRLDARESESGDGASPAKAARASGTGAQPMERPET